MVFPIIENSSFNILDIMITKLRNLWRGYFNPQNYSEVTKETVRNHKLYYARIYFTERAGFFKFQNVIISFFN